MRLHERVMGHSIKKSPSIRAEARLYCGIGHYMQNAFLPKNNKTTTTNKHTKHIKKPTTTTSKQTNKPKQTKNKKRQTQIKNKQTNKNKQQTKQANKK